MVVICSAPTSHGIWYTVSTRVWHPEFISLIWNQSSLAAKSNTAGVSLIKTHRKSSQGVVGGCLKIGICYNLDDAFHIIDIWGGKRISTTYGSRQLGSWLCSAPPVVVPLGSFSWVYTHGWWWHLTSIPKLLVPEPCRSNLAPKPLELDLFPPVPAWVRCRIGSCGVRVVSWSKSRDLPRECPVSAKPLKALKAIDPPQTFGSVSPPGDQTVWRVLPPLY